MSGMNKRALGSLKKVVLLSACICLSAVLLTGCDQAQESAPITETTLSVLEKGAITYYLVEDFDRDYYSVTELNKMIQEEVQEYNNSLRRGTNGEASLRVDSVEQATDGSSKVVVKFVFDSPDTYKEYSGVDFFYGTVDQAREAGYRLDISMVDAKDGVTAIGEKEISDSGNRHILITEDNARIICPKKVLYISEGAVLGSDGTVMAAQEEEYTYVITK